jgi:hypothetical protein
VAQAFGFPRLQNGEGAEDDSQDEKADDSQNQGNPCRLFSLLGPSVVLYRVGLL